MAEPDNRPGGEGQRASELFPEVYGELRRLALHVLARSLQSCADDGEHALLRLQRRRPLGEPRRLRIQFGPRAVEPLRLGPQPLLLDDSDPNGLFPLGRIALQLREPQRRLLLAGEYEVLGGEC